MKEELTKCRSTAALAGEYQKQLTERGELIAQLQSQVEILKDTALVADHYQGGGGVGGAGELRLLSFSIKL